MTVQVGVTASGRMSLQSEIRKRWVLAKGRVVFVDETPDGVVLRTAAQIVMHAKALAKQYDMMDGGSVDDFLANRMAETGK